MSPNNPLLKPHDHTGEVVSSAMPPSQESILVRTIDNPINKESASLLREVQQRPSEPISSEAQAKPVPMENPTILVKSQQGDQTAKTAASATQEGTIPNSLVGRQLDIIPTTAPEKQVQPHSSDFSVRPLTGNPEQNPFVNRIEFLRYLLPNYLSVVPEGIMQKMKAAYLQAPPALQRKISQKFKQLGIAFREVNHRRQRLLDTQSSEKDTAKVTKTAISAVNVLTSHLSKQARLGDKSIEQIISGQPATPLTQQEQEQVNTLIEEGFKFFNSQTPEVQQGKKRINSILQKGVEQFPQNKENTHATAPPLVRGLHRNITNQTDETSVINDATKLATGATFNYIIRRIPK